jgi:hypothetical protein
VRRHIEDFGPRFSQPIDPEIRTRNRAANLEVRVRTATRLARNPDLISVRDFTAHFYLFASLAGYKVRLASYRNYSKGRRNSRLAVR